MDRIRPREAPRGTTRRPVHTDELSTGTHETHNRTEFNEILGGSAKTLR